MPASSILREAVAAAFSDEISREHERKKPERDRAEMEGVQRGAYARERRLAEAAGALAGVSEERWEDLAVWLNRFAFGDEALPIKDRERDRRQSWVGAEQDALRRALSHASQAAQSVQAIGDAEGLDFGGKSGRDMEGRLGRAFHEVRYAVEEVQQLLGFIEERLRDPMSTFGGDDDQPDYDLTRRRPAHRAFPELMRFWTDEAGRNDGERDLFLTFARAAMTAVAETRGDSPAEWTAGLDEAFKRR